MPKTTTPATPTETPKVPEGKLGFVWKDSVITIAERTVRRREQIRLLISKLANEVERGEITSVGLSEFAAIVVLTEGGDEAIWQRPSPKAPLNELLAALEVWGDFKSTLMDAWLAAIYSNEDAEKN